MFILSMAVTNEWISGFWVQNNITGFGIRFKLHKWHNSPIVTPDNQAQP